jgi:hypothetical protein
LNVNNVPFQVSQQHSIIMLYRWLVAEGRSTVDYFRLSLSKTLSVGFEPAESLFGVKLSESS